MKTNCPKCNNTASTSLIDEFVKDKQEFVFMCKGCGSSFGATLNLVRSTPAHAQNFINTGQRTEFMTDY
jgi:transcription elongation factor Elf1